MNDRKMQKNISNGWGKVKLGDIAKIYDGTHQTPKYIKKGIPFLSVEHITANQFKDTKFISKEVYEKEIERVKIEKGDILMTRIGDIGTAKFIDWDIEASFYVTLALLKIFNKDTDNKFLTYLINSQESQREIWSKTIHVAFPNKINLGDIGKLELVLPPLPEQKRIVAVLELWDEVLEKLKRKIEIKKNIKKGLLQKMLTCKYNKQIINDELSIVNKGKVFAPALRVKGFDGSWEERRLKGVAKIKKGEQLNKEYLTEKGKFPSYSGGVTPSGYTDKFNASKNTIIISEGGNSCGYVNYIKEDFWAGGHCYVVSEKEINKIFLFQYLKVSEIKIMRLRVGSGLPNVQKKDIDNFKINLPSLEEQKAIAAVLTVADEETCELLRQQKLLEEQKRYLLNVLISGEIRVPESVSEQAELASEK